jgi:hypothetical protein
VINLHRSLFSLEDVAVPSPFFSPLERCLSTSPGGGVKVLRALFVNVPVGLGPPVPFLPLASY